MVKIACRIAKKEIFCYRRNFFKLNLSILVDCPTCGYELSTNVQNFAQRLSRSEITVKVLVGLLYFDSPCLLTYLFSVCFCFSDVIVTLDFVAIAFAMISWNLIRDCFIVFNRQVACRLFCQIGETNDRRVRNKTLLKYARIVQINRLVLQMCEISGQTFWTTLYIYTASLANCLLTHEPETDGSFAARLVSYLGK